MKNGAISLLPDTLRARMVVSRDSAYHPEGLPGTHIRVITQKLLAEGNALRLIDLFGGDPQKIETDALSAITAGYCQLGCYREASTVNDEAHRRARYSGNVEQLSDAAAYKAKLVWRVGNNVSAAVDQLRISLQANPVNDMALANWLCYASRAKSERLLNEGVRNLLITFPNWQHASVFNHILRNDSDLAWGRLQSCVKPLMNAIQN